jgi:hypothetical protein
MILDIGKLGCAIDDLSRAEATLQGRSIMRSPECKAAEPMPNPQIPVAVVIERVPLAHRWASEQWRIVAVEPDCSAAAPPFRQLEDATRTQWRAPGFAIELHRSESEGYFLNISSPEPKAFVMWRSRDSDEPGTTGAPELAICPRLVTVSYNEAGRLLDGGEQVDAVALAPEIRAWIEPFVAEHYRPEPKRKSKRNQLYERDRGDGTAPKTGQ